MAEEKKAENEKAVAENAEPKAAGPAEKKTEAKPAKAKAKKAAKAPMKGAGAPAVEKKYNVRGNIFEGIVVSAKADKTVTVERDITHFINKYERYKKVRTRIKAHNPESVNAKEGDRVRIGETRKISKTKSFVVMKVLGDKKGKKGEKK